MQIWEWIKFLFSKLFISEERKQARYDFRENTLSWKNLCMSFEKRITELENRRDDCEKNLEIERHRSIQNEGKIMRLEMLVEKLKARIVELENIIRSGEYDEE